MKFTKEDINLFTFDEYVKIPTKISNEELKVGDQVETLEGLMTCNEICRLAIDAKGNVYPIAESVFQKSYVKAERCC